jgi:hypothetical protein
VSALRCATAPLLAAPVVGVLWWVLAPGGRSVVTERLAGLEAPGAQDAWFAALGALAGLVLAAVWVAARPAGPQRAAPVAPCVVGLLLGCLAGSLLAWGVGRGVDVVLDSVAGTGAVPAAPAVDRLVLTSPAALLVWPLVAALVVAADAARDLVGSAVHRREPETATETDIRDTPHRRW